MVQQSWQKSKKLINQINQTAKCLNVKYCKLYIVFDGHQNRMWWSNGEYIIYFSLPLCIPIFFNIFMYNFGFIKSGKKLLDSVIEIVSLSHADCDSKMPAICLLVELTESESAMFFKDLYNHVFLEL